MPADAGSSSPAADRPDALAGRYTVGGLAEACGIPSHMASEHLRLMQRCGFLDSSREGRTVYYTIVEPHLANIMKCISDRFGRRECD